MNKKIFKVIAPSLLAMAVAGGTIAGATYALFTSESKTDIAITSGEVKVSAEIVDQKVYSGAPDSLTGDPVVDEPNIVLQSGNTFACGGTASLVGNTLTLDRIASGDRVTFRIKITNSSTISIKYRTSVWVTSDNGLFEALVVSINGQKFNGLDGRYSAWEVKQAPATPEVGYIDVVVDLPTSVTKDYSTKSCAISFGVEAVQSNAHTEDVPAKTIQINNKQDLDLFRTLVNGGQKFEGYTVKLMNNIDYAGETISPINMNGFKITFDGNGKTVSNYKVVGERHVGLFGFADSSTFKNTVIDGVTAEGINHVAAFVGHAMCGKFENISVKNAVVESKVKNSDDGDKAGAIVGYLSGETVAYLKDSIVENCTVKALRDVGGAVGIANGGAEVSGVTVKNSKVVSVRMDDYTTYTTEAQYNYDKIVGRKAAAAQLSDNTAENVTLSVQVADGLEYDGVSTYTVTNAQGMVKVAEMTNTIAGVFTDKTVKLGNDIDMAAITNFTPIGHDYDYSFSGTFDGDNKTISNLNVSVIKEDTDNAAAGLFGTIHIGYVKNLTIDNATIVSSHWAGGIVGHFERGASGAVIDNCKVTNSTIKSVGRYKVAEGEYDDADKAGGIAGYTWSSTITNCSVSDCTIQAYRDLGGIAGISKGTTTITGNTVTNVTLVNDRTHNYNGYTSDDQFDVNDIVGEISAGTVTGNTATGVTKTVIGA